MKRNHNANPQARRCILSRDLSLMQLHGPLGDGQSKT